MIENRDYILSKLQSLLHDKVKFAIIFGSVIKQSFNDESDVDIAVFLNDDKHALTYNEFNKFRFEISSEFERDVDVIILNTSDIIITMQALANGELLMTNDLSFYNLFKAKKISEYLDFKISRKIIEDNLLNGGRNYA